MPESEVQAPVPDTDLLSTLREGRVAEARAFLLRRQALTLDEERRNDALGALLASRVMVKPHQVGVVQRVLSARRPRFVLADEVGLGKTIEAGMIFSALRLSGLAARVLVVAPSHLTVQWLAELFHKFQQLFTLVDGERLARSRRDDPDISPWEKFATSGHQPRAPLAFPRGGRRGRVRGLGPGHRRRGPPPPGREGVRRHRGARTADLGSPAAHRHADAARPGRVPRAAQAARPGDRARLRGVSRPSAAAGGAVADGPRPARGRRRRGRRGGHRAPVTLSGRQTSWPDSATARRCSPTSPRPTASPRRWSATVGRAWAGSVRGVSTGTWSSRPTPSSSPATRCSPGSARARSGARRWPVCSVGSTPRPRRSHRLRPACSPTRRRSRRATRSTRRSARSWTTSGRTSPGQRCSSSPRPWPRWRASARCSRRMGSRRSGTTAISRWSTATARWPASAIRRGPASCSAPRWAARAATSSSRTTW